MSLPERLYTADEYLALEREAAYKNEFVNGRIYTMSGASPAHNQITFNMAGSLQPQLRGRSCRGFTSDMRVQVSRTDAYFYPDLSALCGTPTFAGAEPRSLVNPTMVVEVSSGSTEAYDRGDKFAHYALLPSLAEYLLVAQDQMRVERYLRIGGSWQFDVFTQPDDVVELPSIACALRLGDVYDHVDFPEAPPRLAPRIVREADAPEWAATV